MKYIYFFSLIILISCGKNKQEEKTTPILVKTQETIDTLVTQKEITQPIDTASFLTEINRTRVKSLPITENTNFDSFIEPEDYNEVSVKALKLEQIYPDFYNEYYNFKTFASYRIKLSDAFHTLVVALQKTDNEMESRLINYNLEGNIIDSKVVAYDEIAEGWSKIESKIEQNKVTINNILWIEEKQETIEVFYIDKNGKIKPLEKTNSTHNSANLIDIVIQQLGLEKTKIDEGFVTSQVWSENPDETIVIIPEIAKEDEDSFNLNLHIILTNTTTGTITHKYLDKGWQSDAIAIEKITVDTTSYHITENAKAFGIRVFYRSMSQPNPYNEECISLFIKENNDLKKILNHYTVFESIGETNVNDCNAKFDKTINKLSINDTKTNEYYDILVQRTKSQTNFQKDENGECNPSEKIIATEKTLLKFDGKEYIK